MNAALKRAESGYAKAAFKPPFVESREVAGGGIVSRSDTMLVYDGENYAFAYFEREVTDLYALESWVDAVTGSRTKVEYWRAIPKVLLDSQDGDTDYEQG